LLRILAAAPDATGIGVDTDESDLARGRDNARARGLACRVTFVRESGVGTRRGPADLVLCLGASHALLAPDADRGRTGRHVAGHDRRGVRRPGSLVDLIVSAGFRPAWIKPATLEEWEDFESGYQCDEEEWLATHGDHPKVAEISERIDQHRSFWLRGYYGLLGQAYLTLVPVG
jgi:hypothetical protein